MIALKTHIIYDDYVLKLEFIFTDFKERFRDYKVLKSSCIFLVNPFLFNIVENGCPISHHILIGKLDLEVEFLKLLVYEHFK